MIKQSIRNFLLSILFSIICLNMIAQEWQIEFKKGESLYYNQKFEEAYNSFKKAKEIAELRKETENDTYYKYLLLMTGPCYYLGLLSENGKIVDELLALSKRLYGENSVQYANCLDEKANWITAISGNYLEANSLYLKALEIKKRVFKDKYTAEVDWSYKYLTWSNILISKEYPELSDLSYMQYRIKKAADLYGTGSANYAGSFGAVAAGYRSVKNYQEALRYNEEALKIFIDIDNNKKENKNAFYGLFAQAFIDEGEMMYLDYIQSGTSYNLIDCAEYISTGIEIFKDLGTWRINLPKYYKTLGIIYLELNDLNKAQKAFQESEKINLEFYGKSHFMNAPISSEIGLAYMNCNMPNKALPYITESCNLYLNELKLNFKYFAESEKKDFYNNYISPSFESFNTYVYQYHNKYPFLLTTLFNYRLATKGILINDQGKILRTVNSSQNKNLKKLYEEWKIAKNYYSKLISQPNISDKQYEDSKKRINSLERSISDLSSVNIAAQKNNYSFIDLQKVLNEKEAAIEIIRFRKYNKKFTDSIYYAAIIVKKGIPQPDIVYLKNGNDLESKWFYLYRKCCHDKNAASYNNDLYNQFWLPIKKKLIGVEKIYLSLDGIYNLINVNTLFNPLSKKFLIEELEINLVGRTDELINRTKTNMPSNAALFGRPSFKINNFNSAKKTIRQDEMYYTRSYDFSNLEWKDLPATEIEVNTINQLLKKKLINTNIYLHENSTEKNLKNLKNPSILHIATHGFFSGELSSSQIRVEKGNIDFRGNSRLTKLSSSANEDPMHNTGLILAGVENFYSNSQYSETEDGVLTAYEATTLELQNNQLVVLSACETGLGKIVNGEGVYGLQRAFSQAGAKSILMSVWSVDDAVTKELMIRFYEEWFKTNNKNLAFRKAQISIMKEYPQPFYWGAFILIDL